MLRWIYTKRRVNMSRLWKVFSGFKMKVFMNSADENWILDRIHREWLKHTPLDGTASLNDCELIWLMAPWKWRSIPPEFLVSKSVLCTIHHIDPSKFAETQLAEFTARDQFVDAYHVPNKYTANFISNLTSRPIHIISYWFDPDLWYPVEKNIARKTLSISEDRFVIGSFQRDTEGGDLKSPKLAKGPDLFCDYVEKISDDKTLVLLGGWRRQYIINRLNDAGIEYKYIEMAPFQILRQMYAACDLYIVSSRHEGGPQALLEAPAMKVPIISTRMGIAEDVICENCIIDIEEELYFPTRGDVERNFENVQKFNITSHIEKYVSTLKGVIKR